MKIGGVVGCEDAETHGCAFFQANDPKASGPGTRSTSASPSRSGGGAILKWLEDTAEDKGLTVWSLAGREGQWFAPSRTVTGIP